MTNYQLEPEPIGRRGDLVVGDPAERQRDTLLLGELAESGPRRRLWLDASGEQVVAIVGKRGTGKSYTLGVLIEGLAAGQGATAIAQLETPRAGLVLDIMDIYWTTTIPLTKDGPPEVQKQHKHMSAKGYSAQSVHVEVWIPAGFENSDVDPPNVQHLRLQAIDLELDDWAGLFGVDIYSEPRGMLIADAIEHVHKQGFDTDDGARVAPKDDYNFEDLIDCLDRDSELRGNYRPDTIRSVRQRMLSYAALELFKGPSTSLSDLLKTFSVSVLMLARLPDALKSVLVSVLVKRVMRERRDASFAQKRLELDTRINVDERERLSSFVAQSIPRAWVFLDEAQVLASTGDDSVAREALVKYAKEGRNYGLSLAVATQQPSALDARLMSQAETLIAHQLTAASDATVASQNIRSPKPNSINVGGEKVGVDDVLRRLGQGEAVFSTGNAPELRRLVVARIRPRVTAHGGYEA